MKGLKSFTIILIAVVVAAGCTFGGKNGSTNDLPDTVGYVMEGIDVPDDVLAAAKTQTKQLFDIYRTSHPDYNYINWRIENLEYSYAYYVNKRNEALIYSDAYKASNGMKIIIYQMNYEILTQSPENIVLAGGMYITEDNWVMPDYPNSHYLVFEQDGEKSIFLHSMMENDCSPGDDIFTDDLLRILKNNATEPKIGKYILEDAEGDWMSWVLLKENKEFQFNKNVVLSYMPRGTYSVDGDKLTLYVNENESYIFTIDGDKLIFDSDNDTSDIVKKEAIFILSDKE